MTDHFDDDLRRTLRSRADQVPRRADLSRAAIGRARGIRRRRRIASATTAAALVAIALPVGLQVGDAVSNGQDPVEPAPTPSGPTRVELDLGALPEEEAPALPYLDGRTIVGDGIDIEVPGRASIEGIAPVSDGVYVATDVGPTSMLVTRYAADGSTEKIGRALSTPVSSADGEWVAYTTGKTDRYGNPTGDATVVLVDDETGDSATVELPNTDASQVSIHAIVDGTTYFSYDDRRTGRPLPLQSWSPGDPSPQPVAGDLDATAVSPGGRLVAHLTKVTDVGACSAIQDRDTGESLWRTCTYRIWGFSPDGEYVWAVPARTEGYGPTSVAILDARNGELIRRYAPAPKRSQITFHDAVFEDRDSLLVRAEQDDGTALVRCEVLTDECEAAEPLTDGTADPPGPSPYLLPATR